MKVTCPGCRKSFNVKDEFAGRSGKCPACGAVLTIPEKPDREDSGAPPGPCWAVGVPDIHCRIGPSECVQYVTPAMPVCHLRRQRVISLSPFNS